MNVLLSEHIENEEDILRIYNDVFALFSKQRVTPLSPLPPSPSLSYLSLLSSNKIQRILGTPAGLLFNEIKMSQNSVFQPLIDLAYFALELEPGKYLFMWEEEKRREEKRREEKRKEEKRREEKRREEKRERREEKTLPSILTNSRYTKENGELILYIIHALARVEGFLTFAPTTTTVTKK
jgi:hypothetical protein